ncbi:MAG: HAMP domain-containing sensor histidine kinase [Proteobacteria bacterium]|nr:HAMP domain-containing sensor histidine kinase [Pseudomonadota bacterium]
MTNGPKSGDRLSPIRTVAASALMRQAITVSLIFTAATLLAGAVAILLLSRSLYARLDADARQMAENLAITYQLAGLTELKSQIASNAATTRDFSNLYLYVDKNQTIVFGNFNIKQPFTGSAKLVLDRDIALPGKSLNDETTTFLAYGIEIPSGWIITARDMRWITNTRNLLVRSASLGLGAALILSIILAVVLARRSENRITALNRVLDRVAKGDLSARYVSRTDPGDDIGRVAAAINRMLDQLSLTMDSLRHVSNDVAHDLRTPLTRLKTRIEPLLSRSDLPPDAAQDLELAEAEIDAIVRTFNAVLRIAQIEGGNDQVALAPVDLSQLCSTIHEMLSPVAEEMGHALTAACPNTPITVDGDREMLAQAIVNLVENAMRHCPAPAQIAMSVTGNSGIATIKICDTGPGIPEAERDKVLRRFYRLEESRNTEGSGLGLSLTAAIIRRHGGTMTLGDNAPGLCVTITLPTA